MILAFFVYILLIFYTLGFATITAHLQQKYYWSLITFLPLFFASLVLGLRDNVGVDYLTYKIIYLKEFYFYVEPLYKLLNVLLHKIHAPYYFLFIAVCLLQFLFIYKGLYYHYKISPWFFYFLYVGQSVFFFINGLRQGIAICIVFYAVALLVERRKYKNFFLWIIIAFLFHKSALLAIFFLPLSRKRKSVLDVFVIQLFIYSFSIFFQKFLYSIPMNIYAKLIESNTLLNTLSTLGVMKISINSGLGVLLRYFTYFIVILLSKLLHTQLKESNYYIYFRFFLVGIILQNITGLDMNMSRLSLYFSFFHVFVIAYLFTAITCSWKKFNYLTKLLFAITLSSMMLQFLASVFSGINCSPFQFIPMF